MFRHRLAAEADYYRLPEPSAPTIRPQGFGSVPSPWSRGVVPLTGPLCSRFTGWRSSKPKSRCVRASSSAKHSRFGTSSSH